MKYFFATFAFFLFFAQTAFAQNKIITHKIEKGETIHQIARKYQVTPFDIYQLNPDAQRGLQVDTVLLIPGKTEKAKVSKIEKAKTESKKTPSILSSAPTTHLVVAKETLYGIEKKYDVTDADLKKANPDLTIDGLKIGMVLTIPSKNATKTPFANVAKTSKIIPEEALYHEVLPKETKYSIARQYGTTIQEIEKRNPEVADNLPIGYQLLIRGTPSKIASVIKSPEQEQNHSLIPAMAVKDSLITYVDYEIQPKETLYSLSKMFAISQEELLQLNPELNQAVAIGMLIKVPSKMVVASAEKKVYASLTKNIAEGKRKRMALLLPFNVSKIEGDTINSAYNRLKKDKFLNMTLDFYAGALIAIDSAKTLGLPIDIEIYDSQETKNSSNVAAIIRDNKLQNANAIVGPFYQSNAEVAAQAVRLTNVPVISPLSKDLGNAYPNLYQTIPTSEEVKNKMFAYMRTQNGNIMAVVDRKKESILKYLQQYQNDIPLVAFKENGSLSTESLKSMLVKGKTNYVVMETANTWMIKTTIATMLSAMPSYSVQLVILEPNETLDFEEIKFTNLIKLQLMYPSVTRDYVSPEAAAFDKKYKKINAIYPSDYATRGFDVTFDTMMRLVQNVKFEQTVNAVATNRVENKFEYYKKDDGGYTNKGVHIMYYDTDLTIKEVQ
ncbi:muramidase family protein [Flavobacterium crassostreae]|uniref:Peptidoglycan-binding protein n=1 Tax=Flavobacterium crassostreae TaxID=1763534 RepID=A0A1B9E924_9FLAO|nr:LysM peptidoglycan-binding domain-containing protein [Flavobacterium crassostreae]OCB78432.1 peptidoglycan-binding protein [Flavobacterium crassostreae]